VGAAKVSLVDAVALPRLVYESLIPARLPRGRVLLGGYKAMLLKPVPLLRHRERFEKHAKAVSVRFATGFETLFGSGIMLK
jgi:hypothetical protein